MLECPKDIDLGDKARVEKISLFIGKGLTVGLQEVQNVDVNLWWHDTMRRPVESGWGRVEEGFLEVRALLR